MSSWLTKYRDGGELEKTNDPTYNALSSVIMQRNRGKNFVDRAYNYQTAPILPLANGDYATHQMAYDTKPDGTAEVYPTVIQQGAGLKKLGDDQAWDYAHDNNEFITVPSYKMAEYLSNKGYKNATGMSKMINGGILGGNDVDYSRWNSDGYITGNAFKELPQQEIEPSPSQSEEEETTDEGTYSTPQITPINTNYEKVFNNYSNSNSNEDNGFSQRGNRAGVTPAKSTVTGESIYQGFIDRGLSNLAAASMTGNLYAESAFDTSAVNPSSKAFGLAQYLGSRKKALIQFAKEKGKQLSDLNLQLDFIVKELGSTHANVTKKLNQAASPEEASDIVMKHFEIPSPKEQADSRNKRISHTLAYYKKAENGTKIDSTSWLSKYNNL